MATVYACEDQLLGRLVAVKVLAPAFAADEDAIARFQREARAVARVSDHPNVVTIYDIGEPAPTQSPDGEELVGAAFIVMEYFPGGTLADRLRSGDPIPRPTALTWLDEAAAALDHAHRAGIVHRDVKPANLLLDANGRLAVGDFGIARMASDVNVTSTGMILGTAAYLSPEQALGQKATAASDRYALAVVAFELLTGGRPFTGEHPAAQARAHVESNPPAASTLADLPLAVDHALWRGLDKQPDNRWPTAGAMVDALEDALGDEAEPLVATTAATEPVPPRRRAAPARAGRSWGPVLVAAVIVGLLAGGAIAAVIGGGGGGGDQGSTTSANRRTAPRTATTPPVQSQPQTQAPATSSPKPASAAAGPSELAQQGHSLVGQGNYPQAIDALSRATRNCPVEKTDPCAYALYDLGHALRLAGRPQEAIAVLEQRLQNADQRGVVQAELKRARKDAGQKPGKKPKQQGGESG
jgi:serine/threonine-protein kinase